MSGPVRQVNSLRPKLSIYLKLISASVRRRKARAGVALLSMVISSAVLSGLVNVYYDIGQKMSREFRAYGANLVLAPRREAGSRLVPEDEVRRAAESLAGKGLVGYAPYLYGVVGTGRERVVVVGTDLEGLRRVSPYWRVTGGRGGEGGAAREALARVALVGGKAAGRLRLAPGDPLTLVNEAAGRSSELVVQGLIQAGDREDNQVFIPLDIAQALLNREGQVNGAWLSVMSGGEDLLLKAALIEQAFPGLAASPVRQIARAEGLLLEKIRSLVYLVVVIMLLSGTLGVGVTMMTGVVERRREIGLKKALGATGRGIAAEFLGEGAILGMAGGILGCAAGYVLAQAIGLSVFGSTVDFRWPVLPVAVATSLLVSGLAILLPLRVAARVEPAVVMRED